MKTCKGKAYSKEICNRIRKEDTYLYDDLEGRNSEVFFSQDQRSYRKMYRESILQTHSIQRIEILSNIKLENLNALVIFQNEEIQISVYLLKDGSSTCIDEDFFTQKNGKSSRELLVPLIGHVGMTVSHKRANASKNL